MADHGDELVYRGMHLHFFRASNGWEYVQRTNAIRGVTIVAITNELKILFVEQFRTPLQKFVIELPAGLVDPAEDEINAVRRELTEETDYECNTAKLLCKGTTSPGLTDEQNSIYLASEVRRIHNLPEDLPSEWGSTRHSKMHGVKEEGERIIVHEVPVHSVITWLAHKQSQGKVIDLRIYAGLFFASKSPLTPIADFFSTGQ
jgi:ADP-ribose pyrophosphatase